MLFPAVLFSFSVGTKEKIYRVCGKYGLGNFHTSHPKISSDRQGGELLGVKMYKKTSNSFSLFLDENL